jgi:hypothetical protein
LIALAAEQLAIDVRADIHRHPRQSRELRQRHLGPALRGAFDKAAFTNYLLNAAIKAYLAPSRAQLPCSPRTSTPTCSAIPGLQRVNEAGDDAALPPGHHRPPALSFNSVQLRRAPARRQLHPRW